MLFAPPSPQFFFLITRYSPHCFVLETINVFIFWLLKMEAVSSSETFEIANHPTRYYNPEDHSMSSLLWCTFSLCSLFRRTFSDRSSCMITEVFSAGSAHVFVICLRQRSLALPKCRRLRRARTPHPQILLKRTVS